MPEDSPTETKELKKVGSFLRLLCSFAASWIGRLGALGHSFGRSGAEEQRGQSFLLFSAFSASLHLCGEVIGALGLRLCRRGGRGRGREVGHGAACPYREGKAAAP